MMNDFPCRCCTNLLFEGEDFFSLYKACGRLVNILWQTREMLCDFIFVEHRHFTLSIGASRRIEYWSCGFLQHWMWPNATLK
jgi:hypothetical protein